MDENTLSFTGPNIYRAVYVYETMETQGYSVNLTVNGIWSDTHKPFSGSGLILDTRPGVFLILYNGQELTVGGPTSAKEDISAKGLSLVPNNLEVVKIGIDPVSYQNLSQFYADLSKFTNKLILNTDYKIVVFGDAVIDTNESVYPTILKKLENNLTNCNFVIYEKGIGVSFNRSDLSDLPKIDAILESNGVGVKNIETGRILLLIRTNFKINESQASLFKKASNLKMFKIYLLKIIKKPVQ